MRQSVLLALRRPKPNGSLSQAALIAAFFWGAIAAASPPDETTQPVATDEWDMIAFEAKIWGEPVSSWQIDKNGVSVWIEVRKEPNAPLGQYKLAYHLIKTEAQQYAELVQILEQLPDPAPDHNTCRGRIPDMAYGTVRLTKGATTTEIGWNSGCREDEYLEFLAILERADQLVAAWGRNAPVSRIEDRGETR